MKKKQHILYDTRYKREIAEVRKEASLYLVLNNIPGATFAIAKEGKIIYSEGMGLASVECQRFSQVWECNSKFRTNFKSN